MLSELDKKNPLSLIFISFSNDLLLKKETYKAIKSEERGQNITKCREVVSQKVMFYSKSCDLATVKSPATRE